MKDKYTIVFMGTPDFAVPSLQALTSNGYDVPLVVTRPDRPKGRGRQLAAPPVKLKAQELNLKLLQPAKLNDAEFLSLIQRIQPDFFILIAYGHILSESVLQMPKSGAINVHASLLPQYRGPAPIHWAILNGDTQTGVTTMYMDKGLDTGDILLSQAEPILPDDTAATLHDRLAHTGADLLIRTLKDLAAGKLTPTKQDHSKATYAPLLKKQDGRIEWQRPAHELEAFIRGMTPWPGAFTFHEDKRLKIFRATATSEPISEPAGTVLKAFPGELAVATAKGVLSILEIQGPSGKRLLVADFLRGYQLPAGTLLK